MGFCVSKQKYSTEQYENSNIKKYEGLYINEKKKWILCPVFN